MDGASAIISIVPFGLVSLAQTLNTYIIDVREGREVSNFAALLV
jgi:hypothetical protein